MTTTDVPAVASPTQEPDGRQSARLRLTLTALGRRGVLDASGTLDAESSVAVDSQHDQLVRAGFDEVVLDVTGLRRIDESGAVALAQLWARLRTSGVVCRVRGLHPVFADSPLELLLFIRSSGAQALTGLLRPVPRPI